MSEPIRIGDAIEVELTDIEGETIRCRAVVTAAIARIEPELLDPCEGVYPWMTIRSAKITLELKSDGPARSVASKDRQWITRCP